VRVARLRVEGVSKRFGPREVLDAVSLDLLGPGAWALLGPNGAGKSTLLQVLAGLVPADAGQAWLDDAPLLDGPPEVRRAVGYVPESTELLPYLTVAEVVRVAATLRGAGEPAPELLERLGVQDFLHQRIASLSLGQRRRGLILAGLVGDPGLLLLDEPTNGLDPPAVEMLGRLIRDLVAEGRMVLFVTHDLGLVEAAGAEVLRLEAGVLRAPLSSHG